MATIYRFAQYPVLCLGRGNEALVLVGRLCLYAGTGALYPCIYRAADPGPWPLAIAFVPACVVGVLWHGDSHGCVGASHCESLGEVCVAAGLPRTDRGGGGHLQQPHHHWLGGYFLRALCLWRRFFSRAIADGPPQRSKCGRSPAAFACDRGAALIYGTLLIVGLVSLARRWSWGLAGQCLIAFTGPIVGAACMTSISNFSFNVRYTIVGFPYFCLLVGAAIVFLGRQQAWLGSVALLALTLISSWSLVNYYNLPDYGRTNVRAAIASWRTAGEPGDLLSVSSALGVKDVIMRYLTPAERHQHTWLGGGKKAIDRVRQFFETHDRRHVYLLLARDWQQRREAVVREAFAVQREHTFIGVKLLNISRR